MNEFIEYKNINIQSIELDDLTIIHTHINDQFIIESIDLIIKKKAYKSNDKLWKNKIYHKSNKKGNNVNKDT